mgnify:CR=1 FL=1
MRLRNNTIKIIFSLLILSLSSSYSLATTVYNTDADITIPYQLGKSLYWSANLTPGSGPAPSTWVRFEIDKSGSINYRPGREFKDTSTISNNPRGWGWATPFLLLGNIPAGQWDFNVVTKNNQTGNGPGFITITAFKNCTGTNVKLLQLQGNTDVVSTTNTVTQTISASLPQYNIDNCRLKFEYWLTMSTPTATIDTNYLLGVNSNQFYTTFPTPTGGVTFTTTTSTSITSTTSTSTTITGTTTSTTSSIFTTILTTTVNFNTSLANCQDLDGDGYQASSCGGYDCNDNDANISPALAETCNGIDDNCNSLIDENILAICGSNVGDCRQGTKICNNGMLSACSGGIQAMAEACDFHDNDCDGFTDEDNVCLSRNNPQTSCIENWICGEWTPCTAITQESTRNCTDSNNCGAMSSKPVTAKSCNTGDQKSIQKAIVFVKESTVFKTVLGVSIASLLTLAWYISRDKLKRKQISSLKKVIKKAKKQGASEEAITNMASEQGWPQDIIDKIMKKR